MSGMITARLACLLLVLLPAATMAQLTITSRNSDLKFDGTNFGTTDQFAFTDSLSDPFDAIFADSILHDTPNGFNAVIYSMSQHDVVSATLLSSTHEATCNITQNEGSPITRLTGDFTVEFTVAADTVITFNGALSGSSNIANDPYTSVVLDISSVIGSPDLFNSLFDDFPLITTLTPGETYRLRVDMRATCNLSTLSAADMVNVTLEVEPDSDDDGLLNFEDNCVTVANPDQLDTNGDGFGNRCDADLDDSCQVNFVDLGIMKSVFFSTDADADFDGSGNVNFTDLAIMKSGFFAAPGPSGLANACDP